MARSVVTSVRIEIWSDVVCPWCYIGKRRLETALEQSGHRDEIEVVYRSFQLNPSSPRVPDQTVVEHLGQKYGGGPAAGQQMIDRVEAVAAEEGLLFRLGEAQRVNTVDAHRLLHLALAEGGPSLQYALSEELLAAYFLRAENVADHDQLRRTAAKVGLDTERVDEVLASEEYADAVEADIREAASLGANGVPFFVIDRKYGVSGAQPADTFVQVIERAWSESHPQLEHVGQGHDDDVCGPDGCAV
ncbi:MAG: DsbA family oxidoreductase [Marmoricola sp.]|nr:DsbA family oxidoreductase [Marmoricola sp.]